MTGRKAIIAILFVLLAVPIPFSLFSWLGTIMAVTSISAVNFAGTGEKAKMAASLSSMFLAGSYPVTYICSLVLTVKKARIYRLSFLPLLHIILFAAAAVVWSLLERA